MQRDVVEGVRSQYLSVVTDVARVGARQQSINSARSALDSTQAGYGAGTRELVDVLNAQRVLFRARLDHATARYDYVLNTLRLRRRAGILKDEDLLTVDKWLRPSADRP